ncbi:hypothetical protein MAR_021495 [Mya arenaria]|uniref:Uncharacterized protein n=1 Tax=Mya arenaria TaxID=6604 RepID=A0ABY7EB70_MYAAR|nr:hypothetical protein MAR_021495 [Mya arenaria]
MKLRLSPNQAKISYLFPAVQSTITSVFVGFYDVSTVFTYLLKVCYESGISRGYYCLGLALVHLILVGISTCFLLPSNKLKPRSTDHANARKENPSAATYDKVPGPDGNCISEKEKFLKVKTQDHTADGRKVRALHSLCSIEYLLHVFWMCCHGLRFVTFLGFFSTWMGTKFGVNSIKENYYLGVFSYVTMGTAITAVTAGMLHDCQRRQYASTRYKHFPCYSEFCIPRPGWLVYSSTLYLSGTSRTSLLRIT